jgi:DNA-directed RNA polymerase subunit H (RpoH/RPB5)
LAQLNEKLRIQLAEKEGTIITLTRTSQTQQHATVSLFHSFDVTTEK